MVNPTRRKLLQGLATLPALPALAGGREFAFPEASENREQNPAPSLPLNVVFHGLWAFVCWDAYIQAVAPCFPKHGYAVGGLSSSQVTLVRGGGYWLQGVTGATTPYFFPFDEQKCAVFPNQQSINYDFVYCSILLPIPNRVSTPYYISKDSSLTYSEFYQAGSGPPIPPDSLAMAHVLTYTSYQGTATIGPNVPVTPDTSSDSQAKNLHVFASELPPHIQKCPKNCSGNQHPFDILNCVFPNLNAVLNSLYFQDHYPSYHKGEAPPGIGQPDVQHLMNAVGAVKAQIEKVTALNPVNCHPIVIKNTSF